MMTGGAVSDSETELVVRISTACSEYHVQASVWTGACGTRPFGRGMLRTPATAQVIPRRKKSQWKPAGFLSGKWRACAVREETL